MPRVLVICRSASVAGGYIESRARIDRRHPGLTFTSRAFDLRALPRGTAYVDLTRLPGGHWGLAGSDVARALTAARAHGLRLISLADLPGALAHEPPAADPAPALPAALPKRRTAARPAESRGAPGLGELLFDALAAEEEPDARDAGRAAAERDRGGLGGFRSADGARTILDGAYDLDRVAEAFLAALARRGGTEAA